MAVNRYDLINYIANSSGTTRGQVSVRFTREKAYKIVSAIISGFQLSMKNKEKFILSDVGVFTPKLIPDRKGVHPRTREEITIPEHYFVKFKPSKQLKRLIQRKEN